MNYNVNIPLLVVKRTKYWIAYSPHLKTYGYSLKSAQDAIGDFDRAIETFFHVHESLNNLNEVFLRLGWQKVDDKFTIPKLLNTDLGYSGLGSRKVKHQIAVPQM